jgi:8-oxo-dGTP diphosphatase
MLPNNPAAAPLREIAVVCGILRREDGCLLAAQRGHGDLAGKWEFPGGKIDPGESPEQAIVRELNEELGCTVEAADVGLTVTHVYPKVIIHLTPVTCRLVAGTPQALEHREIRWVSPAELPSLDWAAADIPIVEALSHGGAEKHS